MKTSDRGINLIKKFEGLRLIAYKPVGSEKYYTIGYGHYGSDIMKGQKITEKQAEEFLRKDLQYFENEVTKSLKGKVMLQHKFDALVSFTYNVGVGNFNRSTLLKKVQDNPADITIRQEFEKWNKAGGKVLFGLKRRRKAEADLYFS